MNMIFRVLFVTYWVVIFLNGNQAFAQQSTQIYNYTPTQVYEERIGPIVCTANRTYGQIDIINITFSADIDFKKISPENFVNCAETVKKKLLEGPKIPEKKSKTNKNFS